jgi:hypothetical protein
MGKGFGAILGILSAVSLQIEIWQWEMHMIARHGWNWGYKDEWNR